MVINENQSYDLSFLEKFQCSTAGNKITFHQELTAEDEIAIQAHINKMTWDERKVAEAITDYIKLATDTLQADVDSLAQSWGYDDINSTSKYAARSTSPFYAEAILLGDYSDAVWVYGLGVLAVWQAGGAKPTIESIVAGLPVKPTQP